MRLPPSSSPRPLRWCPHQLIDHPGWDALAFQPGRKAVPKIMGAAKLQMCKVASGAMGCVVVQAAKAVPRQDRPCADRHAVSTAGTGEDQRVRVGIGRQLTTDRLDHQRSQGDLTDAGVALGARLEATAEPIGLVAGVDHL
jgi:hypothetical protein